MILGFKFHCYHGLMKKVLHLSRTTWIDEMPDKKKISNESWLRFKGEAKKVSFCHEVCPTHLFHSLVSHNVMPFKF